MINPVTESMLYIKSWMRLFMWFIIAFQPIRHIKP